LPDTFRPTKKRSVSTLDAIVDKLTNFWFRTLERSFVTDPTAREAANRLGRNPIGWDEFVQRRRHSAWQAALHALQDDPDARLPSPPSS
jgi:hypothetical protein